MISVSLFDLASGRQKKTALRVNRALNIGYRRGGKA
jgi:hypothetical protein